MDVEFDDGAAEGRVPLPCIRVPQPRGSSPGAPAAANAAANAASPQQHEQGQTAAGMQTGPGKASGGSDAAVPVEAEPSPVAIEAPAAEELHPVLSMDALDRARFLRRLVEEVLHGAKAPLAAQIGELAKQVWRAQQEENWRPKRALPRAFLSQYCLSVCLSVCFSSSRSFSLSPSISLHLSFVSPMPCPPTPLPPPFWASVGRRSGCAGAAAWL